MNRRTFSTLSLAALALLVVLVGCTDTPEPAPAEVTEEAAFFTAKPVAIAETPVPTLEIGASAPDFRLPGVDGKFHSLNDFSEAKVLVIVFTCNHCPTAQAYEERIQQIVNEYGDKGVSLVAISPNSPIGLLYEELGYSDMGDTFEDMQLRARDHKFTYPYLYDGDDHAVSIKYGPVATPHAYVFDQERKLQYVGRVDDSEKPGTGQAEDLRAAIDALLAGQPVALQSTKAFGCSVKWAWKDEWKVKVDKDWAAAPVELSTIDEAGIAALLKNDSDKLRLINVWATWCGPCIIEYPEFIVIHRMFKDRAFEFVSLSADSPDARDDVLKFLTSKSSAVRNFQFHSDDQYALIEAIDPKWNGALPFTILVEPGGKVVYRQEGVISPLELKRAIVDHPLIGRYY